MSLVSIIVSILFSLPLIIFTKLERLFKDASLCYEVSGNIAVHLHKENWREGRNINSAFPRQYIRTSVDLNPCCNIIFI